MYEFRLIGYPIQHSLSPWIHRKLLERSGLTGNYRLYEITPDDDFGEKIIQLMDAEVDGFNVTVPYKQKIIPYLDELDPVSKEMEAVNTVLRKDGKWIGYNTDGIGYLRSLDSAVPDFFHNFDKNILIIGAGGAARAIYYALVDKGFSEVDIANRTKEKAVDIAKLGKTDTNTVVYSIEEARERLQYYDLIIQTTSVGMKSISLEPIINIDELKHHAIVSDIVYQPIRTQFLQDAKKQGARLVFGHTMLLYQAQYSFEIWTGERVDVTGLEQKLFQILEGR